MERRETLRARLQWQGGGISIVISFLNRKDGAIFPTRSGELVPRQGLVLNIYATIFMMFFNQLKTSKCNYFEGPKCYEWSTIQRLFVLNHLNKSYCFEKTQVFEGSPIRRKV